MWIDSRYISRDRHERFALRRRRGREIEVPGMISARSTIKGTDFQLIKCEDLFTFCNTNVHISLIVVFIISYKFFCRKYLIFSLASWISVGFLDININLL